MIQNKYIVLLIVVIIGLISCTNNNVGLDTDWEKYELKGAVKLCEEVSYNIYHNSVTTRKEKVTETYYRFNEKGYLSQFICSYHKDSTGMVNKSYQYIPKGDYILLKNNVKLFKSPKSYIQIAEIFNKDRQRIQSFIYYPNGLLKNKTILKYNDKGELIETKNYSSNGKLQHKEIYEYDTRKRVKSRVIYNSDNSIINKSIFQYKNNDKIGVVVYNNNDDVIYSCTYKYNDKHQLLEECSYISKMDLKYKIVNEYDNDGNMVKKLTYDKNGILKNKLIFQYDKHHNWIYRIRYNIDNKPIHIMRRKFTYYQ